jgi:hypothetical protein
MIDIFEGAVVWWDSCHAHKLKPRKKGPERIGRGLMS